MKSNKIEKNKTMGAILSDLRKKNGFSQVQIAQWCGVSKSSISHYETGETIPPLDLLIRFADIYDVTIDYILGRCYSDYNFSKLFKAPFVKRLTVGQLMGMINNLNVRGKNYLAETILLLQSSNEYIKDKKER